MTEDDKDLTESWRTRAQAAEAALVAAQAEARERLMRAELKAEAIRAGMVDLDGLKLLDLAQLPVDEHGQIIGPDAIFEKLKRTKPWLFGAGSSSAAAMPPRPEPPRPRQASELSHEEWLAARAALIRRR